MNLNSDERLKAVLEFHERYNLNIEDKPIIPEPDRIQLRIALLEEELEELKIALANKDIVEVADAIADLEFVLLGAAIEFGLASCFKEIFDEITRSNKTRSCKTYEDAEASIREYIKRKNLPDDTQDFDIEEYDGVFNIYLNGKNIKGDQWEAPNLEPIIKKYQK